MATSGVIEFDPKSQQIICQGNWDLGNYTSLQTEFAGITLPTVSELTINGQNLTKMDTAGAWLLIKITRLLAEQKINAVFQNIPTQYQRLLTFVDNKMDSSSLAVPQVARLNWVTRVGENTVQQIKEFTKFLNFTGRISLEGLHVILRPRHLRWNAIAATVDKTGFQALAIIALLSFMIGVVIAYQMGFQLRNYGANVFIVDLLGLSVLREFGPLLSAIMVAGRTGSAFTAQLGTMQINQEIDALNTMGVPPEELLLLPRIIGLFIALPLLTMWADIFGIFGGMIMANDMLGVSWYDFLDRFQKEIPLRSLFIGLGKAPVFAIIIASIGCFQGTQVQGSADSIGTKTTRSVVLGIFFIILADAAFSIIFSKLRL